MISCPKCKQGMDFHLWKLSISPKFKCAPEDGGVFYCTSCGKCYIRHTARLFNVTHLKAGQKILLSKAPKEFAVDLYRALILDLDIEVNIEAFTNDIKANDTSLLGTSEIIYKLIQRNRDEGILETELFRSLRKIKIPSATVSKIVSGLTNQGLIFYPSPGRVKVV